MGLSQQPTGLAQEAAFPFTSTSPAIPRLPGTLLPPSGTQVYLDLNSSPAHLLACGGGDVQQATQLPESQERMGVSCLPGIYSMVTIQ